MRKLSLYMIMLTSTLILGCSAKATFAGAAKTSVIQETRPDLSLVKDLSMDWDTIDEQPQLDATMATVDTSGVEAGAESFSQKVVYTTYLQDDDPMKYFPSELSINGEKYRLCETKTPIYIKKENNIPKTLTYLSEVFTGDGEEHIPDTTIAGDDGYSYELISKEKKEQMVKERAEYKEAVVDYEAVEAGVVIPDEKNIEITDQDTHQTVNALMTIKNKDTLKSYWSNDFRFPITITGYEADTLLLGNSEIPKNAQLIDYANDFLEYLKLDPEAYKISSIDWQGEPYIQNGTMVRDAVGRGEKYVEDIRVTYGAVVQLPAIMGSIWECVYEQQLLAQEQTIYTMACEVTYEREISEVVKEKTWIQKLVDTGKGIIVATYEAIITSVQKHPTLSALSLVIVALFLGILITKKIRNRCIYDGRIRCLHKKHNAKLCKTCVNFHRRSKVWLK